MSREQPLTSPEAIDDVVDRYAVTEAQAHHVKFYAEKEAEETREEYAQRKLNEPADLRRYWSRESRMNGLRKKWPDELGSELILDLEEIERQSESLADFDVAFRLAIECFGGVFDRL